MGGVGGQETGSTQLDRTGSLKRESRLRRKSISNEGQEVRKGMLLKDRKMITLTN